MSAFQYSAMEQSGKKVKGIVEADSARSARQQLRDCNLVPLSVNNVSDKSNEGKRLQFSFGRRQLSTAQLTLLTHQMATLLEAGIPIDEMLTAVAEQAEQDHIKRVLLGVRARVLEGFSLAKSLDAFPRSFPKLYRTTIASGEKSGKLSLILHKLADYIDRQRKMKSKILQAMLYPSLMSAVSILIVIFLLIYVVPKIVTTFTQVEMKLPLSTQILIAISNYFVHYGLYTLLGLVILIVALLRGLKNKRFRYSWDQIILKIPLLGRTIRTINEARFGRTFGILTAASVPVLEAMTAACELITPSPMRQAVSAAIEQVREGVSISHALKQTNYFAPMFIYLVSSGENSGSLEKMLDHATTTQEENVNVFLEGLLTLFEPMLILVMGGVVLFIVMAIMLPIFELNQFTG